MTTEGVPSNDTDGRVVSAPEVRSIEKIQILFAPLSSVTYRNLSLGCIETRASTSSVVPVSANGLPLISVRSPVTRLLRNAEIEAEVAGSGGRLGGDCALPVFNM